MKKSFFSFLLCLIFFFLFACENIDSQNTTVDTTTTLTTQSETAGTVYTQNESTSIDIALAPASIVSWTMSPYLTDKNDLYYDLLKKMYSEVGGDVERGYLSSVSYYALHDMDGNGIPELLMADYNNKWITLIYAIVNGEAVKQRIQMLGELPPVLFENGILRTDYHDMELGNDIMSYWYHQFENGELRHFAGMSEDRKENLYTYGEVDKKTLIKFISKKRFDKTKQELEANGRVVELDWKPLNEYGK